MTEFEVLHIINILTIWGFAIYLLKMVGEMKYGLWACTIQAVKSLFIKQLRYSDCLIWINKNKRYVVAGIMIPLLAWLSLTLLTQLNVGLPQIRTVWTVRTSIFVWIGITLLIHLMNSIDEPRS